MLLYTAGTSEVMDSILIVVGGGGLVVLQGIRDGLLLK
jgi:hypothetical protein